MNISVSKLDHFRLSSHSSSLSSILFTSTPFSNNLFSLHSSSFSHPLLSQTISSFMKIKFGEMGQLFSLCFGRNRSNSYSVDYQALTRCTPFKRKQLKSWYHEFLKDCPQGYMTKEVFILNFQDVFFHNNSNVNAKLSDYIFNKFDTNKDGVITFDEFIKAIAIPSTGSVDEKLDWAFSMYDLDDDGYVTREEMLNIVKAKKGFSIDQQTVLEERVERIFSEMDSNNDGMLSREEFINGFKNDPSVVKTIIEGQQPLHHPVAHRH